MPSTSRSSGSPRGGRDERAASSAERRPLAARRRRLLPDPARRDAALQPQGRPDGAVLLARELQLHPPRPGSSGRRSGSRSSLRSRRSSITLLLLVPTVYWVHLKLPRLRPVIGFLALVPFVVPPIILVVGLLDVYRGSPDWFYAEPYGFLVGGVRDPRVPVHLLLARRGLPRDRRAHADGGFAEPRRGLADDAAVGDPAEHPRRRNRGRVPDARDRDGRVHDRLPRDLRHLPGLHPVHQPEQGVSCCGGDADRFGDHLGGDARAARRRPRPPGTIGGAK